jgi:FixJ family two-component response regulator
VNEPPGAPTILIVDEDVGLVWWLGELFHEAGYQSIPALSSKQALALVRGDHKGVDLLVIDPRLWGASRLIKTLSRARPPKLVFTQGPGEVTIPAVRPVAVLERPDGWGPISRAEWRQTVQRILSRVGFRAAS